MHSYVWTDRRIRHLKELSGAAGKTPGEPMIASMGSTGPPNVEEPVFIRDHLVCDGAQVTRPSIDPYREPVDTQIYLHVVGIRLSQPLILSVHPDYPSVVRRALVRAAYNLGLLAYIRGTNLAAGEEVYGGRILLDDGSRSHAGLGVVRYYGHNGPIMLKTPSTIGLEWAANLSWKNIVGVIVDEDHAGSDTPIEVATSHVDRMLRRISSDGQPMRDRITLIASSRSIRGADDIFKLVALGADAVALGDAALIAADCIGKTPSEDIVYERIENLAIALQKEVKLLAGAAGVSSIYTSLVGNRELLRAIGLDADTRARLGVKLAGVG
jgi:hypothetical protein